MLELKNVIYEKLQATDHLIDTELLKTLQTEGNDITIHDLNRALMDLDMLNLISVRWVTENKRRIEISKNTQKEQNSFW